MIISLPKTKKEKGAPLGDAFLF